MNVTCSSAKKHFMLHSTLPLPKLQTWLWMSWQNIYAPLPHQKMRVFFLWDGCRVFLLQCDGLLLFWRGKNERVAASVLEKGEYFNFLWGKRITCSGKMCGKWFFLMWQIFYSSVIKFYNRKEKLLMSQILET